MKRVVVLALLAAGCIDFRKDLEGFCERTGRCAADSGTAGGQGGSAGGAMAGGAGGGGGGGGGAMAGGGSGGGDAGVDGGTDAGQQVCMREQCPLASYRQPRLIWTLNGSAPNDVWFGGRALYRFDGTSMSARSDNPVATQSIFGVQALSPSHVWVSGNFSPDVFFFDGTDWRSKKLDAGDTSYGMYSRGIDEHYLVADQSMYRYDGGVWERFYRNTTFDTFFDIHGRPGLPLYAVADDRVYRVGDALNVTVEAPPVAGESLYAVNVSPSGQVWAVGSNGIVVRRGEDAGWEAQTVDVAGNGSYLFGVWVRSDDDVWIAGELGTILHWRADAGWTSRGVEAFDGGVDLTQITWQDVWGQGKHVWFAGTTGINFNANFDGGVAAHFLLP